MQLKKLSEIIWSIYQDGRVSATSVTYKEADIIELCTLALSQMQTMVFVAGQKRKDGNDNYAMAPMLSTQRFKLSAVEASGKRRADMSKFDLFRLPKNTHIVNVYPVGEGNCGAPGKSLSLVAPGEENFYLGPNFSFFQFGVVKGTGVDAYNLPPCTHSLDIESTFNSEEIDVSNDVGYNIAQQVLGMVLRVPGFSGDTDNPYVSPQLQQLRRQLPATPDPNI